jgi:hypothetical protein
LGVFSSLTAEERVQEARRHLDALESWLRRLTHEKMSARYGATYLSSSAPIPAGIRTEVNAKISKHKGRFPREADATSFGELTQIIVHPKLYDSLFRDALCEVFPAGARDAELFFSRLRPVRNDVSHGRTCSLRQLERAVCYTNDVIDALKSHYSAMGTRDVFAGPTFTRYVDSLGNDRALTLNVGGEGNVLPWFEYPKCDLKPGDVLTIDVEVDASYYPDSYEILWRSPYDSGVGPHIVVPITVKYVAESFPLSIELMARRDWHRFSRFDDSIRLLFRALPLP